MEARVHRHQSVELGGHLISLSNQKLIIIIVNIIIITWQIRDWMWLLFSVISGSSLAVSWAPSMAGCELSTEPPSLRQAPTSLICLLSSPEQNLSASS